jgi:hypothetical protein
MRHEMLAYDVPLLDNRQVGAARRGEVLTYDVPLLDNRQVGVARRGHREASAQPGVVDSASPRRRHPVGLDRP